MCKPVLLVKCLAGLALALAAVPLRGQSLPEQTNGAGVRMIRIPAGTFLMGSPKGATNELPVHRVTLDAFWMDRTAVTQAEYERLMGRNPSRVKDPNYPVEMIRWSDAARYCNARSVEEGLDPVYDPKSWACDFTKSGYRLPTEAEWEYACRAGTTGAYGFGDNDNMLQLYAWFKRNSGGRPHAVATKKANLWGLHDMTGNLFQWCNDFYDAATYAQSPAANPTGPASGAFKVLRGGCYQSEPAACRSAARHQDSPAFADACVGFDLYGFRCVRSLRGE